MRSLARVVRMGRWKQRWHFERVAGPFAFTEGPVWDGSKVLFTDIPTSKIMCYEPVSGRCIELLRETEGTNGLALDRDGRLYGCQSVGRRVVRYRGANLGAEVFTVVADRFRGNRLNSPNDLVVDSRGRVWFTDPRYGEDRGDTELDHESVFRADPLATGAFEVVRVTFDTRRPNGLALSPDESELYVAESPTAPKGDRQLRAYPVQADGSLGPGRILFQFGGHRGIDGMCVDATGHIVATCGWARSGPGPRIAVFDPDGSLIEEHPTPAQPTNVCFGGPALSDVYLTAYDGCLWKASTHRHGLSLRSNVDFCPLDE
jgi:gluconolactonase